MSNKDASANISSHTYSRSRIGVIELSHTWTIENFSFFIDKKTFTSASFGSEVNDGIQWYLELHPKGPGEEDKDYVSLFLYHLRRNDVQAKFEISILSSTQAATRFTMKINEPQSIAREGLGWSQFIRRDALFADSHSYLPDDKLVVHCKISYVPDTKIFRSLSAQIPPQVPGSDLSTVLAGLLESQTLCDVVLGMNGKEFSAHKIILAARSPALKAIFEQDPDGEKTSRVEISGMDEATLLELLRFIYTGKSKALDRMSDLLAKIEKHVSIRANPVANSPKRSTSLETKEKTANCMANLDTTETSDIEENARQRQSIITAFIEERHGNDLALQRMKKFSGDKSAFYGWWGDFRANVHDRLDLSIGQKVTHLRKQLVGEAAKAIQGTSQEEDEYLKILGRLFMRFGNVVKAHIEMILQSLGTPRHSTDYRRLVRELREIDECPHTLESEKIGNGGARADAAGGLKSQSSNGLNHPENRSPRRKVKFSGVINIDAVKKSERSRERLGDSDVPKPETKTEELKKFPSKCQSRLTARRRG